MSGQPPQLRDQAAVRSGLRVGGAVVFGIGLIFTLIAFADFFSSMGSFAMPTNFWMGFIGLPMMAIGGAMMRAGFLGSATRYVAGEVAPTVKDALSYVGVGAAQAVCPKCGGTNRADAKFCDHCGAALSLICPTCGHPNAADAAFCDECGKPLTAA
jgi:ribosomal protein L40E